MNPMSVSAARWPVRSPRILVVAMLAAGGCRRHFGTSRSAESYSGQPHTTRGRDNSAMQLACRLLQRLPAHRRPERSPNERRSLLRRVTPTVRPRVASFSAR